MWQERAETLAEGNTAETGKTEAEEARELLHQIDVVFGPEYGNRMAEYLEEGTEEATEYAANLGKALEENSDYIRENRESASLDLEDRLDYAASVAEEAARIRDKEFTPMLENDAEGWTAEQFFERYQRKAEEVRTVLEEADEKLAEAAYNRIEDGTPRAAETLINEMPENQGEVYK